MSFSSADFCPGSPTTPSIRRPAAAWRSLLTYLFAGGVLFLFFRLVIPQILVSIASIFANLQNYAASLQRVLDFLMELIAVDGLPQEVIDAVNLSVESAVTQAYDLAVSALPKALEYAMNFTSGVYLSGDWHHHFDLYVYGQGALSGADAQGHVRLLQ